METVLGQRPSKNVGVCGGRLTQSQVRELLALTHAKAQATREAGPDYEVRAQAHFVSVERGGND